MARDLKIRNLILLELNQSILGVFDTKRDALEYAKRKEPAMVPICTIQQVRYFTREAKPDA